MGTFGRKREKRGELVHFGRKREKRGEWVNFRGKEGKHRGMGQF